MEIGLKHTIVGQFFEEIGHQIIGGDLSRDENGDICLWRTETAVEVKASGHQSSYGFRLNVEQIENYERLITFPFTRAWYMLFAYRNRPRIRINGKRQSSELSRHVTRVSINKYLADSTEWCLIVDLSIVSRWRRTQPISTKSILGHLGVKTVNLKCRSVYKFMNGGLKDGLENLGLNPSSFGVLDGLVKMSAKPDLFSRYDIEFPLTVILPLSEINPLQRALKRRGFHLGRRHS